MELMQCRTCFPTHTHTHIITTHICVCAQLDEQRDGACAVPHACGACASDGA